MASVELLNWSPTPDDSLPRSSLPPELRAMLDERDKIIHDQNLILQARRRAHEVPSILHHYTDASGLKGIAFDGSLWLSDFKETNDPTDGLLAGSLFQSAVKDIYPAELQKKIQWAFGPEKPEHEPGYFMVENLFQRFIACFTANPDQIYQWVHYGAGGAGYCLGLDTTFLTSQESRMPSGRVLKPEIYPVIYDPAVQRTEVNQFIDVSLDLYRKHETILRVHPIALDHLYGAMGKLLEWAIRAYALDYKNEHYSGEQEWRCVIAQQLGDTFIPLVRVRGNKLISYLSINAKVRKIKSGPKADHQSLKNAWGPRILASNPQVELSHSAIPLR